MNEDKLIKTVNSLLALASISLFYGCIYYVTDEHSTCLKQKTAEKVEVIREEPEEEPEPTEAVDLKALDGFYDLRNVYQNVEVTYLTMQFEYLGRYFITAYCPEECGWSWQTSSGATCHYSENRFEPTTAAIDIRFHGYNEILLVGDPEDPESKVYITEDTGPGVQGAWIDCFVETMDEVRNWETRYEKVFKVTYQEHKKEGHFYERINLHLPRRSFGNRVPYWPCD